MWRFVLARRWWVGHVLVVLFCGLFIWLGRWQWDRAESPTGGWQNFGYALQWPLFAVVLVAAWVRFLWLERQANALVPEDDPGQAPELSAPVPRRPAPSPIPEDDPDDELAAYNAFLARLAEQDRQ